MAIPSGFFARGEGKECAKSPLQRQGYSYWLERWLWALKPPRPAPCYPRQRITRLSKGSPAAAQAHVAHGGGLGYAVHIAAVVPRAAGIGAAGVISRSPQHQREAASSGDLLFATPSVLNRDIPYRNRIARVGRAGRFKDPFGPTKIRSTPSHSLEIAPQLEPVRDAANSVFYHGLIARGCGTG
jgi:hypothetical protein